jgi:hypothetical protein
MRASVAALVTGVLMLVGCAPTEPPVKAAPPAMRRLSNDQYRNTIADIFGPQITVAGQADPLTRTDGLLAIGARAVRVTPAGLEKFYGLGKSIAQQVVAPENRAGEFPCTPEVVAGPDAGCARQFFSKVGRLLYRRPLTAGELEVAVTAANEGAQQTGDFYRGIALSLANMLTTPQFLFVVDELEPDPAHPGMQRLTGYAKAARLSYLLWNSTPGEALLGAAERGELQTDRGLRKAVDRMMASPRLEAGVRAFLDDFLRFDQFETLEKDSVIYPAFTVAVIDDAREQVLRTAIDLLLVRNGDYRDLFTTQRTFVTGALARIYHVPVSRPTGGAWSAYEFPAGDPRAGLITEIGFAALASHPGRSSPTLRGRAIREELLCQKVPDPPGNVDFSKFEAADTLGKTARQRLTAHRTDPACSGCHQIMDPIGLGLENLDGVGQFRTSENGAPIDPSGELDGRHFADAKSLGKAIHDDPAAASCVVERLASYALGRKTDDKPYLQYLGKEFADDGYRIPALLRRIALGPAFFAVAPVHSDLTPATTASRSSPVLSGSEKATL